MRYWHTPNGRTILMSSTGLKNRDSEAKGVDPRWRLITSHWYAFEMSILLQYWSDGRRTHICSSVFFDRSIFAASSTLFDCTVWMSLFAWQHNTVSQAGTPRHDNCVHLPVSWVTIIPISYKKVKTSITNKNCSYKTHERTYTKRKTHEKSRCPTN